MAFESVNPATGEKVRRYRAASGLEISEALDAATAAFHSWSRIAVSDRALHLHGAANVLRESKKKWALLMAEEMGKPVSQAAGEQLKKVVLELGGSDPYVILEDADLAQAAAGCAEGRLINAGQSCIAAKRMIVVGSAMERFRELLVREMSARRMGDPREESTHIGPLARADIRLAVASQVARSLSAGARCLLGGQSPEGPGFFYPPTV
ncbi:MAG TPA: aldehyde dehydrogenase family protein, partial [Spirochaetia bacterium]|nr:aldehyde dehydrogenase family protein [Spirochaetia bacterium]